MRQIVEKYSKTVSALADWMETAIPEGLIFYEFPENHRRRIRTSNVLESIHHVVKRRTRVVRLLSNQASCLRLVSAVLMEISEEWETGHIYFDMLPD